MSTISSTIISTVTIGSTGNYASPLTIIAGGVVTVGSGYAIYGPGTAAWTIADYGTIDGSGGGGISLAAGGSIGNSALIKGYNSGVDVTGAAATVTNAGTIEAGGAYGDAASLTVGGYVSNASGGMIVSSNATKAGQAVDISGGLGTVVNAGTILSQNDHLFGVLLEAGGYVTNTASAFIGGGVKIDQTAGTVINLGVIEDPGYAGVELAQGGTVIDAGTIIGSASGAFGAVFLGGSGNNLLELETGYHLVGAVYGLGSAQNTLELSGSLGAITARYDNLGLSNFQTLEFGANFGHDETFLFTNTAGTLPVTIANFATLQDIVDLRDLGAPVSYNLNGDLLTIVGSAGTVALHLGGSYATQFHLYSDLHGGTDVEPACFARGTLILTEAGERPVESLAIGDKVTTLAGDLRPVKWIGRRGYKGAFLLRNSEVWPVRVRAGALGPDRPRRDLYLSAHHAIFLDGLLFPAECLVNGSSILRCDCPEAIEYFHIELASHDLILAEGAAAETFVDCDSRGIFHNAHEFALLYPGEEPPRWRFCAPRVEAGRDLDRVRARLLARAHIVFASSAAAA